MNDIKKLKELGFKQTTFHKAGLDPITYEQAMVPDIEENKWEWQNGKRVSVKVLKVHPKSDSFWVLKYNEIYTLWVSVKNHSISKIWLENKNGGARKWQSSKSAEDERVRLVFDISNKEHVKLTGKDQIINLLPKQLRRDFLISQLFGS